MRRAGTVVGTAQGVMVLRAADSETPGIGARVVDDRLEQVGKVVDVFGPVDAPYLVVSPNAEFDKPTYLGSVLYLR